ncbi:MAG: cob(I)yrinic acid a,c-diamide adenosyltransferase [Verrucomicrobiota bacterium]
MSIATRKGDRGETDLLFGRRVPKTHPRIGALGATDELNAALGLVRVALPAGHARQAFLASVQQNLIRLMGELACLPSDEEKFAAANFQRLNAAQVAEVDALIAAIEEEQAKAPTTWSLPGAQGHPAAAAYDFARTVVRRAEREVALLLESGEFSYQEPLRYLNRLSDACWLLARESETPAAS